MKNRPDILTPAIAARERIGVFGKTGSGKDYLIKTRLLPSPIATRIIAWDPKGEYADGAHPDAPPDMRVLRRVTVAELADLIADDPPAESGELAVAVVDWPRDKAERVARFHDFTTIIENARHYLILIAELGMLPKECAEDIEYIACLSRVWDAPAVFVCQRATQVPRTAREQLSRIVSFRQNRLDDAAALLELCGERANAITSLGQYEFVYWHDDLPPPPHPKKKDFAK